MLRAIIKVNENGGWDHDRQSHYTIDFDAPELEAALKRGGFGPSNYEIHQLAGVEVLPVPSGVAAHPAPLAETEFAVVDCGSGMQRLDWPSGAWWHQLPAGRYRLIAVPLGVTPTQGAQE